MDAAPDARSFLDAAPLPDGAPLRSCEAEAAGPPAALTDLSTTEVSVDVTLAGHIQAVAVTVDVEHPYPRDLVLSLVSPAGTVVLLSARRGVGDGYRNTVFTDSATIPVADAGPSFFGPVRPDQPLARLRGEAASGAWTLRIDDAAAGDQGRLASWSLRLDACPPPPCVTTTVALERQAPSGGSLPFTAFLPTRAFGRVAAARVAMSIDYRFDEDLGLRLWSPRGTAIDLSSGNGGLGADYRDTRFDDAADVAIVDGTPPYRGSYRPEKPLATLEGEGAAGSWLVEVGTPSGPWMIGDSEEPPRFLAAALELDVCELACPPGARARRIAAPSATVVVADSGSVAAAAVRVTAPASASPLVLRAPGGATVELSAASPALDDVLFVDEAAGAAESDARAPARPLGTLAGVAAAGEWSVAGASAVTLELCLVDR